MLLSDGVEQEPQFLERGSEVLDAGPRPALVEPRFDEPTLDQLAEQYHLRHRENRPTRLAESITVLDTDPTVSTHYLMADAGEPHLYSIGESLEEDVTAQALEQFHRAQIDPPRSILDNLRWYPRESQVIQTLATDGTAVQEAETGLEFFLRDAEFPQRVYQIQLPQISLPTDDMPSHDASTNVFSSSEIAEADESRSANTDSLSEFSTHSTSSGQAELERNVSEPHQSSKTIEEANEGLQQHTYQLQLIKREDGQLDIVDAQGKPWYFDTEAQKQQVIDGLLSSLRQALIETDEPRSYREYILQGDLGQLDIDGALSVQLIAAFEEIEVPVIEVEETSSDSSDVGADTNLSLDSDSAVATPIQLVAKPELAPSWWQQFAPSLQEAPQGDLKTVATLHIETQSDESGLELPDLQYLEPVSQSNSLALSGTLPVCDGRFPACRRGRTPGVNGEGAQAPKMNDRPGHEARIKVETHPQAPAPNMFVEPVSAESREPEGDVTDTSLSTEHLGKPIKTPEVRTPSNTPGVLGLVPCLPAGPVPFWYGAGRTPGVFPTVPMSLVTMEYATYDETVIVSPRLEPPQPPQIRTAVDDFPNPPEDSAEHVLKSPSPPAALRDAPAKSDERVISSPKAEVDERPTSGPEIALIQQARPNDPKAPLEPPLVAHQTAFRTEAESIQEVAETEAVSVEHQTATTQPVRTSGVQSEIATEQAPVTNKVERDQRAERTILDKGIGLYTPAVKERQRTTDHVQRAELQSSHVRVETNSGRSTTGRLRHRQRVGRSVLRVAEPFGQRDTARDVIEGVLGRTRQRAQLTRQPQVPEPTYYADGHIAPAKIRPLMRVVAGLLPVQITVHSKSVEFAPVSSDRDSRLAFAKRLSYLHQGADISQPTYQFSLV